PFHAYQLLQFGDVHVLEVDDLHCDCPFARLRPYGESQSSRSIALREPPPRLCALSEARLCPLNEMASGRFQRTSFIGRCPAAHAKPQTKTLEGTKFVGWKGLQTGLRLETLAKLEGLEEPARVRRARQGAHGVGAALAKIG